MSLKQWQMPKLKATKFLLLLLISISNPLVSSAAAKYRASHDHNSMSHKLASHNSISSHGDVGNSIVKYKSSSRDLVPHNMAIVPHNSVLSSEEDDDHWKKWDNRNKKPLTYNPDPFLLPGADSPQNLLPMLEVAVLAPKAFQLSLAMRLRLEEMELFANGLEKQAKLAEAAKNILLLLGPEDVCEDILAVRRECEDEDLGLWAVHNVADEYARQLELTAVVAETDGSMAADQEVPWGMEREVRKVGFNTWFHVDDRVLQLGWPKKAKRKYVLGQLYDESEAVTIDWEQQPIVVGKIWVEDGWPIHETMREGWAKLREHWKRAEEVIGKADQHGLVLAGLAEVIKEANSLHYLLSYADKNKFCDPSKSTLYGQSCQTFVALVCKNAPNWEGKKLELEAFKQYSQNVATDVEMLDRIWNFWKNVTKRHCKRIEEKAKEQQREAKKRQKLLEKQNYWPRKSVI